MVLAVRSVILLIHVMVLVCVMVLARVNGVILCYGVCCVMVLAYDEWWRGSNGLSARRARRTKSSRPEGPPARSRGPEGF